MSMQQPALNPAAALDDFTGTLLRPGDGGYDDARRVHNGMIEKHPALIAMCRTPEDASRAIGYARATGLEIAVRGGGHNVAGRGTIEGGLLIDLSAMRGVEVDPVARTARAEGGVLWGELDAATQAHGLATVGGEISTTGIAGLTLGGGFGWLSSKYGLAVDNLLAVDLVTADGELLTASESQHPDLFWALRGGGGNFGVATSFTYRLHEVGPTVTGGVVVHPLSAAPALLRFYREFRVGAPDELRVHVGLRHAPDGSGAKLAAFLVCHCGDPDEAARVLRPLRAFGAPLLDTVGPMPYRAVNSMFDADLPKGALNYWKSSLMEDLSDAAIDALVGAFEACPAPNTFVLVEGVEGAVTRVPVEATAFPHRAPATQILILTQWLDPSLTDRAIGWTRASYDALRPFLAAGRYMNYLDRDDDGAAAAYGSNYPRLAAIKAEYDPTNVFRQNVNIQPAR